MTSQPPEPKPPLLTLRAAVILIVAGILGAAAGGIAMLTCIENGWSAGGAGFAGIITGLTAALSAASALHTLIAPS